MNIGVTIIYNILLVFSFFLSISIIISWIPALDDYKVFRVIRKVADWYLKPFRGVIVFGGIDFTPWIGIGIYSFILGTFSNL